MKEARFRLRREYQQQYRTRNKDKLLEYDRHSPDSKRAEYNFQHKDQINDYYRRFRARNVVELKGKRTEHDRRYRARNTERARESVRQHYLRNLDNPSAYHPRTTDAYSWKSPALVRQYFETIGKSLSIVQLTDWYRISRRQIDEQGGRSLYNKFDNLGAALQYAYPEFDWDLCQFAFKGKKSGQRWLKVAIEELLPGVEIVEEYQHPDLFWDKLERPVELDLWIPKYRIGIEYHGEHHYHNLETAFGPTGTASHAERDQEKSALCESRGITLIPIPYWWDGNKESLAATLYKARPDVFCLSDSDSILPSNSTTKSNWSPGE